MGFWLAMAGGSLGVGAATRGTTGERWCETSDHVLGRRSLAEMAWFSDRRPVRSLGSLTPFGFEGGMTSSFQVKPR